MGGLWTKKRNDKEDILHAGIAGASYETVRRFGSAVKEHVVAYPGKDNEAGKALVKGLTETERWKHFHFYLCRQPKAAEWRLI